MLWQPLLQPWRWWAWLGNLCHLQICRNEILGSRFYVISVSQHNATCYVSDCQSFRTGARFQVGVLVPEAMKRSLEENTEHLRITPDMPWHEWPVPANQLAAFQEAFLLQSGEPSAELNTKLDILLKTQYLKLNMKKCLSNALKSSKLPSLLQILERANKLHIVPDLFTYRKQTFDGLYVANSQAH